MASEIEGGGDPNRIGALRRLTTRRSATIRETLLEALGSRARSAVRRDRGAGAVRNYIGQLRVTAEGDGQSGRDDVVVGDDPADEKQLVDMFNERLPQSLASAKTSIERR